MKARILVVDDEEEIGDYIRDILQELGHSVSEVFCGEDVAAQVANNHFDIAFVDLKLSTATSGLDVIQFLRQKDPRTKIIAMTGFVDAQLRHETDRLGVSSFLEKPFRPDDVVKAIEKVSGF